MAFFAASDCCGCERSRIRIKARQIVSRAKKAANTQPTQSRAFCDGAGSGFIAQRIPTAKPISKHPRLIRQSPRKLRPHLEPRVEPERSSCKSRTEGCDYIRSIDALAEATH